MEHLELKYYWLYEYMDQNGLTLHKEIQIQYTEEIAK